MQEIEIRQLKDEELITRLHSLVMSERRITAEIIEFLTEVDRRRLYKSCGYRNLFEFCTKELRYSESAAYRRISAVKLAREVPAANTALRAGEINLTAACAMQSYLYNEEKMSGRIFAPEQKLELLDRIKNKTAENIEKLFQREIPKILPPEKQRQMSDDFHEIRLIVTDSWKNQLDRVKAAISESGDQLSYAEVIEFLMNQFLAKSSQNDTVSSTNVPALTQNP